MPLYIQFSQQNTSGKGLQKGVLFTILVMLVITVVPGILKVASSYVIRSGLQTEQPWNVILIGIDTLRADHTTLIEPSAEGRDLTPNLRKLAGRGTVFENAISQAPWTMPAFASILTGKYPHEHGAISLLGQLRDKELVLSEIMREAGFRTGAVVSHVFVNAKHGFDQGFDYFNEDYDLGHVAITSEGVTDEAIKFLGKNVNRQFLLFLHYFDPHYEYRQHQQWSFADSYFGWLRQEPLEIKNLRMKRHLMESADIKYLTDLYDEEIAYTDKQIGRLLDYINKQGLDQNTMIVVVADHGEEFMERGWIGHSITLYEEQIKVPLLIVLPGNNVKNSVSRQVVETRTVFSTILDCLGLPNGLAKPPSSLQALLQNTESETTSQANSTNAYSSVWLPDAPASSGKRVKISALRSDRWKLIIDHIRQREFLYDLKNDPLEKTNMALSEEEIIQDMREKLEAWLEIMLKQAIDRPYPVINQEEINKLKSIGYL